MILQPVGDRRLEHLPMTVLVHGDDEKGIVLIGSADTCDLVQRRSHPIIGLFIRPDLIPEHAPLSHRTSSSPALSSRRARASSMASPADASSKAELRRRLSL